jgi:hypothetical protein
MVVGMNKERRPGKPAQFLGGLGSIEGGESIEELGGWDGNSRRLIMMARRVISLPSREHILVPATIFVVATAAE